jgi:hypothetical protein
VRQSGDWPQMGTAEEYRRSAWECLRIAEGTSNPNTRACLLSLAQDWAGLAKKAERNAQYQVHGYRAKAWECASRAQSVNDPERRADLLRFAGMWMSLTEPLDNPLANLRSAYELPPQHRPVPR